MDEWNESHIEVRKYVHENEIVKLSFECCVHWKLFCYFTETPAECSRVVPLQWEPLRPWLIPTSASECSMCGGPAPPGGQGWLWATLHAHTAAHVLSRGRVFQPEQKGICVMFCCCCCFFLAYWAHAGRLFLFIFSFWCNSSSTHKVASKRGRNREFNETIKI